DRGHNVVVIENDPERVERLSDEYIATIINGDATQPSVLRQAGLDKADAVAALTGVTGDNLATCMVAEKITDDVATVMRTERDVGNEYSGFVDEIVYPERAGGRFVVNAIESGIQTIEGIGTEFEVMRVEVAQDAPVAGKKLSEVKFPRGSLVLSDEKGEGLAGPETVLEPGRSYVVAVESDVTDEVVNLMRG
ncbi:MAG: TrkA family potassium uptake protein, partial [Halobacteria archaeon]|nr:TrkA family potassium uptake protein [Halobacteria archaeon]